MRAFGRPSASTVASVMAVGSRGSEAVASLSQAANSRKGSSAAVKSPLVNQLGCSIGAVSDIFGVLAWSVPKIVTRPVIFIERLYSGCARSRLWRGLPLAAALTLALAAGGCSLSGQFDSVFGGGDKSDQTGSITPPPGAKQVSELPPDADLAFARAAVSEVLSRGGKDASVPWENPRRRARHGDPDRLGLYPGRPDLPRFPGELCERQLASLAAGRSLQAAEGRLGSARAQALEAVEAVVDHCEAALHPGR